MNTIRTFAATVIFFGAVTTQSAAQTTNESVILYNSQPVKVELSQVGKILSFYGLMPGYMDGYELITPIEKLPDVKVDYVNPSFTNASQNAEYAVMSNERTLLQFNVGQATLSSKSISELNDIARSLKSGINQKIVITAFKLPSEPQKLVENRINSAVSYLSIKGISRDKMLTEVQEISSADNSIAINYIN